MPLKHEMQTAMFPPEQGMPRFKDEDDKSYFQRRCEAKVEYDPNTGCWLWSSRITNSGYPMISINGKKTAVTRAVLRFAGHDMTGRQALHSCDTPCCVNPSHLRPGTAKENSEDRVKRCRHPTDYHRRMSEEEQKFVLDNPDMTSTELAKVLDFHPSSIRCFRRKHATTLSRQSKEGGDHG